jgi:hypothetical protein
MAQPNAKATRSIPIRVFHVFRGVVNSPGRRVVGSAAARNIKHLS